MERWGGGASVRVLGCGADVRAMADRGNRPERLSATTLEVTADRPDTVDQLGELVRDLSPDSVDVVVIGLAGDLDSDTEGLQLACEAIVRRCRDELGCHVVVANVCTWAPEVDPYDRRADRLAILALELSIDEGISVLDVDRLVAELGAAGHVQELGVYDEVVADLGGAELVRILEDYGFFEVRPLVPQVGPEVLA